MGPLKCNRDVYSIWHSRPTAGGSVRSLLGKKSLSCLAQNWHFHGSKILALSFRGFNLGFGDRHRGDVEVAKSQRHSQRGEAAPTTGAKTLVVGLSQPRKERHPQDLFFKGSERELRDHRA
jgi:hypothetical protein